MNDKHYQLDTTHRATDRRHCRVIEWVSVKDRLPDHSEDVLIYLNYGEVQKISFGYLEEDCWIHEGEICPISCLTHWADMSMLAPV